MLQARRPVELVKGGGDAARGSHGGSLAAGAGSAPPAARRGPDGMPQGARRGFIRREVSLIERLAELRAKGVLTEEEFAAKKSELLGRL